MRFSAHNQYFHVYDGDTMIFTVTLSINKPSERDLYNLETVTLLRILPIAYPPLS